MQSSYIIDFVPEIRKNIAFDQCETDTLIIENSIALMYEYLEKKCDIDVRKNSLKNREDLVQKILSNIFDNIGINYKFFETKQIIDEDVKNHSAIIVQLNDKNYLIDPTYRQFFLENECQENSYIANGTFVLLSPDPGYYFKINPDKMPIAKELLTNGYIEFTEEVAKAYGDSFKKTMHGRINKNIQEIDGYEYLQMFLGNKDEIRTI